MVRRLAVAVAFLVAATVAHAAAVPDTLPTTAHAAACPPGKTWHAPSGNAVKIPAAAVVNTKLRRGGWTRKYSQSLNMNTLVWGVNKWARRTVPAGRGVIRYFVRVPATGRYRWTAEMASPHPTDWNDFWVSFPGGIAKQRFGQVIGVGSKWLKVYSNVGRDEFKWGGSTVDHNPHKLITPFLYKGQVIEFRISGRSNQVKVAYFGLFRCKTTGRGSPACRNLDKIKRAPVAQCW
eukprot:TRINITY_DN1325_c0_g1_i15.p2 TRINITY_DN1325_c0_g1~~TRINITY_DN1325_c0_g1_i15.p2  ORF type:complete len:235 (-),score=46.63 TRINITY_DN1325_c0_g1_i15:103-807(-)